MNWIKTGFDGFSKGTMGNGGQNLYFSAGGTLQRIYNFDVNNDGYPDLPIANSLCKNAGTLCRYAGRTGRCSVAGRH